MMTYDLIPHKLLSLPSIWNDDDSWMTIASNPSGLSVSEDDKNIYIEASLPGIDPKDIDVTFHEGYLWVQGEAKAEEKDAKRKYYREATNSFSYRVAVPGEVDLNTEPKADYKQGIMTVTFVKSPKAQPKKIEIKSVTQ